MIQIKKFENEGDGFELNRVPFNKEDGDLRFCRFFLFPAWQSF